jgi:hypothetical protein
VQGFCKTEGWIHIKANEQGETPKNKLIVDVLGVYEQCRRQAELGFKVLLHALPKFFNITERLQMRRVSMFQAS